MLGSFSGGGLGFGLSMYLQDLFTSPAKGVERSLKSLDIKVAKVAASVTKNMNFLKNGALLAGVGAVALAATFVAPIRRSIELSDKLADVRKTTGLTEVEVDSFRKTLQGFDTRTSLDDLLDISRIGGQIGIAKKELEGFTKSTDKLAVALGDEFTGGAEQVSAEIGGIGKAFGIFKEKGVELGMLNIGNALNKLGAEGLATAPYLANFTTRLATSARSANASAGDIIGLGAAFSELKLAPEQISGGVDRALSIMGNNLEKFAKAAGVNVQDFKQQFEQNGVVTLLNFAGALKKNSTSSEDWLKKLKELNLNGLNTAKAVGSMANNTELFEEKIRSAGIGMKETSSIMEEFGIKNTTLSAKVDKMKKRWNNILIAIGDMSKGPFSWIVSALDGLLNLIHKFLETSIGKYILSIVSALGTLAVIIGGVIASVALFKILLIKMSFAFGKATAASITHAVATGNLTLAFKLMGKAAWKSAKAVWASFAPILPMVLAIAASVATLVITVNLVRKGMKLFSTSTTETLGKLTGFKKVLATIGGVFKAIKEFWNFFDGENSAIYKGTFDKLKALGVSKETIEIIGSFVVRARALWEGFKDAFKAIWEALKIIWGSVIKPVFKAILDVVNTVFSLFGIELRKLGGDLSTFKIIGGILAAVVVSILIPVIISLTGSMISLAVGVITATLPILLIIGAIVGIIAIFKNWGSITEWLKNKWKQFTKWLSVFIDNAKIWGKVLVNNLWEGVKSKWGHFKDWITRVWKNLTAFLNPSNWFGGGEDEHQINTSNKVSYEHSIGKGQLAMANTAPYQAMLGLSPNVNVDASQGPLHNNVYLDGELIAQNVRDRQQMDNSRL